VRSDPVKTLVQVFVETRETFRFWSSPIFRPTDLFTYVHEWEVAYYKPKLPQQVGLRGSAIRYFGQYLPRTKKFTKPGPPLCHMDRSVNEKHGTPFGRKRFAKKPPNLKNGRVRYTVLRQRRNNGTSAICNLHSTIWVSHFSPILQLVCVNTQTPEFSRPERGNLDTQNVPCRRMYIHLRHL
jgi:hypothetical protein